MMIKADPHLFLHQVLQMCDPLCVLWVAADVVLIKEGLLCKCEKMRIFPQDQIDSETEFIN